MAPELGLDLKLCAMKTVSGFAKEATAIDGGEGRVARLEELMGNLEEEQRKIEAFKRELPLCMHLISDVIEGLRVELEQCRSEKYARTCQEFIPVKSKLEEAAETKSLTDCKDKMNWMSSAQLWTDNYTDRDDKNNKEGQKITEESGGGGDRQQVKGSMTLESKTRCSGGAFVPFKGLSPVLANLKKEEKAPAVSDLALLSPTSRPVPAITEEYHGGSPSAKVVGRSPASSTATGPHLSLQAQQQPPRKARRCWSPELHRRFVLALQQLGGAQVATPKQIRELMKVDGLTNDEVKSHLQKYRLHTRRMPSSSSPVNRPVVMVGNLWGVPQDHYTTSQQSTSQSGSPQSPLQLAGSSRAISVTAGDSCEDEDGKSESYSWK